MKNTYVLSIKHCKLFRHCQFETDSSFSVNDFSIRVHCNLTCTHCCNSIMLYCIDNLYATNTNCTFLHNKCPITNEKWLCFTLLTITDTVEYYCVLICTLTVSWSLHWLNAINNVIILHSNHTSTLETCAGTHCCSHSHPSWQFYFPHPPVYSHFPPHSLTKKIDLQLICVVPNKSAKLQSPDRQNAIMSCQKLRTRSLELVMMSQ